MIRVLIFLLLSSTPVHAVPVYGSKVLVAGPSATSIPIAQSIHQQGGNAVDIAIAVTFGLAVTSPYYASIGGGGFALVKQGPNPVRALDFREVAPAASDAKMFQKDGANSITGGAAVAVPGVVRGLWDLHRSHGRLAWKKVVAPSIQLAREGFFVSGEWVEHTKANQKRFSPQGLKQFFAADGSALRPGSRLKQPGLARALERISQLGPDGFYSGPVAKDLIASIGRQGGIMTLTDLKAYSTKWRDPLRIKFSDRDIYLMPPPSSGGVILANALKATEILKLNEKKPLSVDELHTLTEILKVVFRGRSLLGDPDFTKNPVDWLSGEENFKKPLLSIRRDQVLKLQPLQEPPSIDDSAQTTHISVLDAEGDAVALTITLNGNYGSGVVSEKFGIALNNQMDDFATKPGEPNQFGLIQGRANEVVANKRPLSSMSPTLVLKDGKTEMAVGSPGGPRIISAVFQVIYRVLVNGYDVDRAIQTPRVHHQFLPDMTYVDSHRLSPEVLDLLRQRGHKIDESSVAKVYAVRKNQAGDLEAAFDSRGEGGAGGY